MVITNDSKQIQPTQNTIAHTMTKYYTLPTLQKQVSPDIYSQLQHRDKIGREEYGDGLHTETDIDPITEAEAEVLDLIMYLQTQINRNQRAPMPQTQQDLLNESQQQAIRLAENMREIQKNIHS